MILIIKSLKKITAALICICGICSQAAAYGEIAGHRGTDLGNISIGTKPVNNAVRTYIPLFRVSGERFGVNPNLLAAVCMQESSGHNYSYREDGTSYPAWGIMQIEYTLEKNFADFGIMVSGVPYTLQDRLNQEKSVNFAAYTLSRSLIKYDLDYLKAIQSYNFSTTVLDRIITASGDNWLSERVNAAKYADNWTSPSYGDPKYIEHVLQYFHDDIDYSGAMVRINDKLIDFKDRFPIVKNGTTLVPIRALGDFLGAETEWNQEKKTAYIKKDGITVRLRAGSSTAYVNDTPFKLAVSAEVIDNRTMVPLRFIAEVFNLGVDWNQAERTALLYG